MSIRTSRWPDGVPCWADLTVPDVAAAKRFYAEVLGWSFRSTDIEFGGYVIAEVKDAAAAGIGPLPPGAPATWTLYFAADDVDKSAASVATFGGRLLMRPRAVGGLGRMFIAADPAGAMFGVWQADTHIGTRLVNEPGGLIWEDLRSTDLKAARAFYTAVFGHRTDPLPDAGPDYHLFSLPGDDVPLGGMSGMSGEQARAHWLVYFAVADVEATVAAVVPAGGQVLATDFDSPYGRMARLVDPAGAVFYVLESSGDDGPDRDG